MPPPPSAAPRHDRARRGVLITRPVGDADGTADRVRTLGWVPVMAPMLTIELGRPVRPMGTIDAVVISSGNAVAAVAGLTGLPLLAVGDVTAEKARAAGFGSVASANGDAQHLVALVSARMARGARLLLATGLGEGEALEAGLRQAGYDVQVAVAYAAHPVAALPPVAEAALRSGHLRAALFLSARTARVFRTLVPVPLTAELASVDALAIGPAAAAELSLLPWRQVRVSLSPTLDQVLALL